MELHNAPVKPLRNFAGSDVHTDRNMNQAERHSFKSSKHSFFKCRSPFDVHTKLDGITCLSCGRSNDTPLAFSPSSPLLLAYSVILVLIQAAPYTGTPLQLHYCLIFKWVFHFIPYPTALPLLQTAILVCPLLPISPSTFSCWAPMVYPALQHWQSSFKVRLKASF